VAAQETVLRGRRTGWGPQRWRTRRGAGSCAGPRGAGQQSGVRRAARAPPRGKRPCRPGVPQRSRGGGRAGGFRGTPAARGGPGTYQLIDSQISGQVDKDETSLFDGIDTSLSGIAHFADPNPPRALTAGLAAVSEQAVLAQKAFDGGNDAGTAAPIEAGLA